MPKLAPDTDKAVKAKLRQAVSGANSALFRLAKEANSVNGKVGLVSAIKQILVMLKTKALAVASDKAKVGEPAGS